MASYDDDQAREARRAQLLSQLQTAQTNLTNYTKYHQKAENAQLCIDIAEGGLKFMSEGQMQKTSTRVESGINPQAILLDSLGLKYDESLPSTYCGTISQALTDVNTLIQELFSKKMHYESEVQSITNELNSL